MREERRDRQQGARVRGGMGGPMRGLALNEKPGTPAALSGD